MATSQATMTPKAAALQRRIDIAVVLILLAASAAFWNTIVLYPVKVFVVLLHEISHGIAAVITGGSIVRIEISDMVGGVCYTRGGVPIIVVSSGYLGSMAFGGLILLAARRRRSAVPLAYGIAVVVAVVSVAFVRNAFGRIFGIGFSAVLAVIARLLPPRAVMLAMQYLGATSCLYALIDAKDDLLTMAPRQTDATILAGMTGVPAIVWGALWSVLAVVLFIGIMRAAFRAPR